MTPDFVPAQLAAVPGQVTLSNPSTFAVTGVHHGYRQATLAAHGRIKIANLVWLLEPFAPVWDAWLSWIEPGGFILCHRDAGPHRQRWQLPINGNGTLNGEAAESGVPFRVHHHDWHSVANHDNAPRIVVVIDRDVIEHPERSPFELHQEEECRKHCSSRPNHS